MTFTIVHPSARPDAWQAIHDEWLKTADAPGEVEYILVTDPRWGFDEVSMEHHHDESVINTGRRCYVDAVNTGALQATGAVIIVIADDQHPCEHWDTLLNEFIWQAGKIPSLGCVIQVRNGTPTDNKPMLPLPIVTRNRVTRLGYLLHPAYESMYADNDLYEHAVSDRVLLDARHLPVFPHRHPHFDATVKMDEQYEAQNSIYAHQLGETVINFRRRTQFGKCEPAQRPMVIAVCLPGDHFSGDYLAAWTTLYANLSQHYITIPFCAYCSNVFVTRAVLAKQVLENDPKPDLVLWIDDDNTPTFAQVQLLIEDLAKHPKIGSVAGWCSIGSANKISAGEFSTNGETAPYDAAHALYMHSTGDARSCMPVDWHGFPTVLMRREALEAAGGAKAFNPVLDDHLPWGFTGEDIAFCRHAKAAGVKLYVDWRVKVPHLKLTDSNSSLATTKTRAEEAA